MKHQNIFLSVFVALIGCHHSNPCGTFEKLIPIQAIMGCTGDKCDYSHEVLCPGLEYECLDSTSIMQLVDNYVAKTIGNTPIREIAVFSSIEHYDKGETLSQPKAYFDDMVIVIRFPKDPYSETTFIFCDSGFEGNIWDPELMKK